MAPPEFSYFSPPRNIILLTAISIFYTEILKQNVNCTSDTTICITGKGASDCIIIYLAIDYKILKVKLTEPKILLQH